MSTFRKVIFSLTHLSSKKQREITFLVNSFRSLTQSYIDTLYQHMTNLALYNQDCTDETKLTLNAYTLGLISQDRLTQRYQSQSLKQALETLSSIDNKKTEQTHVTLTGKRKAQCPQFNGYPQLDSKFITIQFKTDDPQLLTLYPPVATVTVPLKDKNKKTQYTDDGQPLTQQKTVSQSVIAVSSKDWIKQGYSTHFDLCVLLSRPRGNAIVHTHGRKKQSKTILPILLKQHAHFKQWLHYQKDLDSSLIQKAVLIPFIEIQPDQIALDFDLLCFEADSTGGLVLKDRVLPQAQTRRKKQDLTPSWVYNLSGKPMAQSKNYQYEPVEFYPEKDLTDPLYQPLTAKQKQKRQTFKALIQSIPKEQVWGLDVGQTKLGILTNQDTASIESQLHALFIGKDHRQWLMKMEQAQTDYQKTVKVCKKSATPLHREQKRQAKMYYVRVKKQYHLWVKQTIQALPWDRIKVLVIENLNSIKIGSSNKKDCGKKFNKRNVQWALGQVMGELLKRVQEDGIYLVSVSPMYTSKECPICGTVRASNRRGETYSCRVCQDEGRWYKLDADYVGSHNIRQRLYYWLTHERMPFVYRVKPAVGTSDSLLPVGVIPGK